MTTQHLPQDPQEVRLKAGALFGTPGVYLAAEAGHTFIPIHCLPDVRRRLRVLNEQLSASLPPNPGARTRKATSK